ncbi:MAG: DUF4248 domain-containing protein [Parabacteroides merdae]
MEKTVPPRSEARDGNIARMSRPEVASRRLKQWIVGNPVLLDSLTENGWTASRRVLTPKQVEQIVRVLGEP